MSVQLALFALIFANQAHAWGERGHHLITRVAVQNLIDRTNDNQAICRPFSFRDHMLAHLSNVPDIVWRANYMAAEQRSLNVPTHFIGLEKLYQKPRLVEDIETAYADFVALSKTKNLDGASEVGTAPWRILQLYGELVGQLKKVAALEAAEDKIAAIDNAMLFAGTMSHFVGDLANPHHTTINYDGQLTGNTGLHAYFESDVILALPLSLADKVNRKAGIPLLKRTVLRPYKHEQRQTILQDPEKLIFAMLLNSHQQLNRLTELDNRYSLIEKSTNDKTPALRKPVKTTARHYQTFAIERLAIGASVLSELWYLAWLEAGKPDMSNYQSYQYPVRPDFITPSYIE